MEGSLQPKAGPHSLKLFEMKWTTKPDGSSGQNDLVIRLLTVDTGMTSSKLARVETPDEETAVETIRELVSDELAAFAKATTLKVQARDPNIPELAYEAVRATGGVGITVLFEGERITSEKCRIGFGWQLTTSEHEKPLLPFELFRVAGIIAEQTTDRIILHCPRWSDRPNWLALKDNLSAWVCHMLTHVVYPESVQPARP